MSNKLFATLLCFVSFLMYAQSDYNKLDEKGKKHGLWKGFYTDTKNPKYEGTFDHGKEIGVFTFYDNTKTKIVIATREFNPNDNSAYTIVYDQLKNKVSEGKVVNKLYEGQWKYYHKASKSIMTIENYNKGKLEGLRSVFYPNGKIAEEMNYKEGKKNGQYKKEDWKIPKTTFLYSYSDARIKKWQYSVQKQVTLSLILRNLGETEPHMLKTR